MKAKDTVMSYRECQVAKLPVTPPHTDDERIAQAQAEISFKAGIVEVTEWIEPRLDKISELLVILEEIGQTQEVIVERYGIFWQK